MQHGHGHAINEGLRVVRIDKEFIANYVTVTVMHAKQHGHDHACGTGHQLVG